jgi:membrane-associated phospholipid phosphatase
MIRWLQDGFNRNTWWSRVFFCALLPIVGLLYPLCNRIAAAGSGYFIFLFPIDNWIPFNKTFIIAYYYWYVQIGITLTWFVFSRHTGRLLYRLIITLNFSNLIASLFYLSMPTMMIRPAVVGTDLLSQMIQWIYAIDLPFNCFPSMHVFWTVIICRFWVLAGPKYLWFRLVNFGGTALVIASTVLIKQHYSPDILGGFAVAGVACLLSDRLFDHLSRRAKAKSPQPIPSDFEER